MRSVIHRFFFFFQDFSFVETHFYDDAYGGFDAGSFCHVSTFEGRNYSKRRNSLLRNDPLSSSGRKTSFVGARSQT